MGKILDRLLWAQSDLQAKALQSSHPDAGGMYHATVRLSLEPDRHFLGHTGRWRFPEKAVGSACWNVCFRNFERALTTQRSHSRCEVRDYPVAVHQKIRPFILYVWTLSEPLNNLYLLGKLTERQGRKVTDLRETMAAGLRHGCSSVCINCLPLRCLKIWKGERYVWPHSWFLFYPIGHAPVPWVCIRWIGRCGTYSTVRGRFFCTQSGYINDSTRALRR